MRFHFTNIASYHRQLLAQETSVLEATQHFLQVISENQHLNAFVAVFEEDALETAASLDAQLQSSGSLLPLHGVVVAIKDVICIEGKPVSAASKMLEGHRAMYDATAVKRLKKAGAVIIGSCNCDEFAMGSSNENSYYGPAKNAANPSLVPGGSSGGSAVAVQAGMCMISLGSDTGGSVRQPADFCGVWGFKPTYGAISRYGLIAYASSFDCIGIFGHNADDIELAFGQIAGADGKDGTCSALAESFALNGRLLKKEKYRFAVLEPTISLPGLDPEIKAGFQRRIAQLQQEGHVVEMLPFDLLDYIVPTYYVLTTAEASSNLGRYDGIRYGHREAVEASADNRLTAFYAQNRSHGFGAEVKRRIMLGSFVLSAGYFDAYFTKAQQVRRKLTDLTASIFNDFDGLLMPVSPTTPWPIGEKSGDPTSVYLADIYTVFANLTGVPAMALPLQKHSNGMQFGLQVLAKPGDDIALHRMAKIISDTSD